MAEKFEGARLLNLVATTAPELSPQFAGNCEPIRTRCDSVDDALAHWQPPFLWKRKSPRVSGSVWFGNTDAASGVYVFTSVKRLFSQCTALLKEASSALDVSFGYSHLLTDAEMNSADVTHEMRYPFEIGVTSFHLRTGIPNASWQMVFGPEYVEAIGRDVLLSAPAHAIELLDERHVFVQLTASIEEARDFETLQRARQAFKSHVGTKFFLGS